MSLHAKHKFFKAAGHGEAEALRQMAIRAPDLAHERWTEADGNAFMGAYEIGMGWTPLMFAASQGKAGCVAILAPLSDVSARGTEGETALIAGAVYGDPECARLLLPGSDLLAVSAAGNGALAVAAWDGQSSYLAALLQAARRDCAAAQEHIKGAFSIAIDRLNWDAAAVLAPVMEAKAFRDWAEETVGLGGAMAWRDLEELSAFVPLDIAQKAIELGEKRRMPCLLARVEAAALQGLLREAGAPADEKANATTAGGPLERKPQRL